MVPSMVADAKLPASVEFGRFRVLPHRRELLVDGQPAKLGGRAFDVLTTLIEARGAVVAKDALMARVWPGQIVEENNLQSHISALRAALGRDRELIRTVSGRGYQFIGEMRALSEAEPAQIKPTLAQAPEKSAPPRLSMVVLPFANIGGDPEQNHFVDGITESLTTDLSRIRGAYVVARNTAFTYKGKPLDVKAISRELNVRYVLEGSVQRGGNRMRVNVQLIDAETGNHLWAERFDKPL